MNSHRRLLAALIVIPLGVSSLAPGAFAKSKNSLDLEPGPTSISDEEKAIAADPPKGIESAVILTEETIRNEDNPKVDWVSYHTRIKILSQHGRSLGNVTIPYDVSRGEVSGWWGRTLLPDGTVQELPEAQLQRQVASQSGARQFVQLKAALPAVGPGCIIDYGYQYKGTGGGIAPRINLERLWPIKHFRFRWTPQGGRDTDVLLRQSEGLGVSVTKDGRAYVIEGHDFPAVKEEPRMPPGDESYAKAYLWYRPHDDTDFWNIQAREYDRWTEKFLANDGPFKDAVAAMKIPAGTDVPTRIRMVYDWISTHITNKSLRTVEQTEASAGKKDDDEKNRPGYILDKKEAGAGQIDDLFIGFVRAVGGVAYSVKVPKRTDHAWDPQMYDWTQLVDWIVAVGAPDDPIEKMTLADAGSGLPFGEIPWWLTGGKALLAAEGKAHVIDVPPSKPERNSVVSTMNVSFADDSSGVHMAWTRASSGQHGYSERRILRGQMPDLRQKNLDGMCGASTQFDLSRAEAPDLDNLNAPLKVICEGDYSGTGITPEIQVYGYRLRGVWHDLPEAFAQPTRRYPIVFPFAKVERQVLDVAAPSGFTPKRGTPPAPVQIDTPFAAYSLTITSDDKGYHAARALTLKTIRILPADYDAYRKFVASVEKADAVVVEFQRSPKVGS